MKPTFEQAKALAGDPDFLASYRQIAASCCAPLIWFRASDDPPSILHNGTITVIRTPKVILGITAAHVIHQYKSDELQSDDLRLQMGDQILRMIAGSTSHPKIAPIKEIWPPSGSMKS